MNKKRAIAMVLIGTTCLFCGCSSDKPDTQQNPEQVNIQNPINNNINSNNIDLNKEQKQEQEEQKQNKKEITYLMDTQTRLISASELDKKNDIQIRLIKNEILARHGYVFSDDEVMRSYFSNQVWYEPDPSFSQSQLEGYELENFKFISNYLKKREADAKAAAEEAKKPKTVVVEKPVIVQAPQTQSSNYQTTYYCCASDYATLRSSASTQSSALARIYTREAVSFIRTEGAFYYVNYNGQKGYVLSKFFSENPYANLNYDER